MAHRTGLQLGLRVRINRLPRRLVPDSNLVEAADLMTIAALVLPVFAVIVAGWIAGASGYLPPSLSGPLVQFAYNVAMPALVFVTIAEERLGALLEGGFIAAFGRDCR